MRDAAPITANAIKVEGLSASYGKNRVLDGVSLEMPIGSRFLLLGKNRSGKTTLTDHLVGKKRPQGGAVRVFNDDPVLNPNAALASVGYASGHRDPRDVPNDDAMNYFRGLHPTWDSTHAFHLFLSFFDLAADRHHSTYSPAECILGQLFLALSFRPNLLILDSVFENLDSCLRDTVTKAIRKTGVASVFMTACSFRKVGPYGAGADPIAILRHGRIVACDSREDYCTLYRVLKLKVPPGTIVPPDGPDLASRFIEGHGWYVASRSPHKTLEHLLNTTGEENACDLPVTEHTIFKIYGVE